MHDHDQERTILVLNSGSSSLKFGLFARSANDETLLLEGAAEGIGRDDGRLRIKAADGRMLLQQEHLLQSQTEALQALSQVLVQRHHARPSAVGHRVVHGGPHLRTHQLITNDVRRQLRDALHFAPLHIPPALALIDEAMRVLHTEEERQIARHCRQLLQAGGSGPPDWGQPLRTTVRSTTEVTPNRRVTSSSIAARCASP
ncbi:MULTISPECIES: hypothetical protein [Paraburkholderia]|uniref:hypothetical protein n=1 Tax=Paraburkholderia TaxID=1822464 RepID=UPI0003A2D8A6|nr:MULTISPECIES: hypothetical protein [Paraburkholderia]MDH6153161.1 acetate kinase [Paraburkholderia sp. WSM4179]